MIVKRIKFSQNNVYSGHQVLRLSNIILDYTRRQRNMSLLLHICLVQVVYPTPSA